jgi:hypothetical protein
LARGRSDRQRVQLARCWIVDRLAGPIPESETDRAIREAGDRPFRDDPGE